MDNQNPLWLPKGSVRAILAIELVTAAVVLCIKLDALEVLVGLAGAVLVYYTEQRRNGQ